MSAKKETALSKKPQTPEAQEVWNAKAKVRVLLNLWDLGGGERKVKKGNLTKSIVRTGETSKDYGQVLDELRETGAIAYELAHRQLVVQVTERGQEILAEGLTSGDSPFEFDGSQVGTRLANALLRWLRCQDGGVSVGKGKSESSAIASYEEFKEVALEVYDRLNGDYNLEHLVPIYRMRREIGERVTRSQFNEWLLEMQANDFFQLMGGEVLNVSADQIEDSITPPVGKLRFFAKRLTSEN